MPFAIEYLSFCKDCHDADLELVTFSDLVGQTRYSLVCQHEAACKAMYEKCRNMRDDSSGYRDIIYTNRQL